MFALKPFHPACLRATNQSNDSYCPSKYSIFWGCLFFLIILFSGIIRFYNLDLESLWMDELNQVSSYSLPVKELILSAASMQQPPLDYLIGYCLNHLCLGQSDWWVRFPAAFFGTATIFLLIWWCKKMFGNYTALAASIILAVSPLHVQMSQEARPYTIFVFFSILCLILFANAHKKPSIFNWFIFSTTLFLLLLSRWVGPIVFTIQIAIFTALLVIYNKSIKIRNKKQKRYKLKYVFLALVIPVLLYIPFLFTIYQNSQKYLSENRAKTISEMLTQGIAMLKSSTISCFNTTWMLFFIAIGLAITIFYAFYSKKTDKSQDINIIEKNIDLSLFLVASNGFVITYIIIYVYKTFVVAKPQYLLLLAPFGAIYLGSFIDSLRILFSKFSKTLSIIVYLIIILAICLPMYRQTAKQLITIQKRDWRGLGDIVNRHQESQSPLFLSITNAVAAWSPPICSFPRYIKNNGDKLTTTIRKLASEKYNKEFKFGTIYGLVFKDFHGSFPVPKLKPFKDLQVYDLKGFLLYRFPGSVENSTQRLILLLSYLASGAEKGKGLVDVNLAMAQALLSLGDIQHAKSAVIEAFNQCRNQNERNIFLIKYSNTLKNFDLE